MSLVAPPRDHIFACAGEMAQRCAELDWSRTSLGPSTRWPSSLRTIVAMVLRSRFPMIITWGEDFVMIYNDAYIPTLGAKHPAALTSRLPDEFAEIWDEIGPRQQAVLNGHESQFDEDVAFILERGSGPEETFFTYSWSHVPPDAPDVGPGGVLTVLAERTAEVVGARRLGLLNTMQTCISDLSDPTTAISGCLAALDSADADLVLGAVYTPDVSGALVLGPSFGIDPADASAWHAAPPVAAQCWTDQQVRSEIRGTTAIVALPLHARDRMAGVLLLEPHRLRPVDPEQWQWVHLVAAQVTQALSHATARADERERIAALADIDAAKRDFVSNIGHEFRTPLTLLLGPLEDALAEPDVALSPTQLRNMHANGTRLLRLVNELLDLARLDLDPRPANLEPVDLTAATRDLLLPFEEAAARAGLTFTAQLDEVGVVAVDPALWEATLINLVANAITYTPAGQIDVALRTEADGVVLEVSDSGVGIPEHDQPLVFDRFHRVIGPSSVSVEGTGLGLALVEESVRALGGEVSLDSEPGRGSTFTVRIALRAPTGPDPDLLQRSPIAAEILARDIAPTTGPSPSFAAEFGAEFGAEEVTGSVIEDAGSVVILVVDDNAAMRQRVSHVLSTLGSVVTCQDGLEALEIVRTRRVDLVVTDVMMPRLDGLGLVEQLRADPCHESLPVVVLSARVGSDFAAEALDLGADDYVLKPFTTAELLARCRSSLELSRRRAGRAAATARNVVLAQVSHELQTPLSVIISALELMSAPDLDDATRSEAVRRAAARVVMLDRLVRQFLDWTRITAGSPIEPMQASVELGDLLDRVVADHPIARVCDELAGSPRPVTCDLRRTEQIMHTLLTNASQAGATQVEVRIRAHQDAAENTDACGYDVEVVDDGHGLDAVQSRALFTPTTATRVGGSAGIGLAVSRATARAQGGELALASSDQHGSAFVLRIPAAV